jgi:hypothetical protein
MKHKYLLIGLIFVFLSSLFLRAQVQIEEKVDVKWWVVPLFALDENNKPVMDLRPEDIKLLVQGKTMDGFTLYKNEISSSEHSQISSPQAEVQRKKVIFLLFDTALTRPQNIEVSKRIAAKIVADSTKASYYVVLKIDPYKGLTTVLGPTADKTIVQQCIESKVKYSFQSKPFSLDELGPMPGGGDYEDNELDFVISIRSKAHKPKTLTFMDSFKTLQQMMAGIQDNRVLYLFSEGMNMAMLDGQSSLLNFVKETAGYLNQCGGIFFAVNPAGSEKSALSGSTGDNLRLMAKESGGKYLEGQESKISETICNSQHAYYEIAFPAPVMKKETSITIEIRSQKAGMQIVSLKSAFRKKRLGEMSSMERGLFILECLRGNQLLKDAYEIREITAEFGEQTPDSNMKIAIQFPFDPTNKKLYLYVLGFSGDNEPIDLTILPISVKSSRILMNLNIKKVSGVSYWRLVFLDVDNSQVLICNQPIQSL